VEEETGLRNVQLKQKLTDTYHTYDESGHHILKQTHWFLMHVSGEQQLTPQYEEQITNIEWADPSDLKKYLDNTFYAIRDVVNAAKTLLEQPSP